MRRYEAGKSARSIAAGSGVSPSAVLRLLRAQRVVVKTTKITDTKARKIAKEYEAGSTMAELEKRHSISHGAVHRALHRVGVKARPSAPQTKGATQ